jgi:hypothetical protein
MKLETERLLLRVRSENVMKRLGLTYVPDQSWTYEGHRYVVYITRR